MAHGKALELRGIRSRVAKRHWTKRPSMSIKFAMDTRQSVRQYPKGSTSENRFVALTRPETYLHQRMNYYAGELFGHPSPKSRARLRHEGRQVRCEFRAAVRHGVLDQMPREWRGWAWLK